MWLHELGYTYFDIPRLTLAEITRLKEGWQRQKDREAPGERDPETAQMKRESKDRARQRFIENREARDPETSMVT